MLLSFQFSIIQKLLWVKEGYPTSNVWVRQEASKIEIIIQLWRVGWYGMRDQETFAAVFSKKIILQSLISALCKW